MCVYFLVIGVVLCPRRSRRTLKKSSELVKLFSWTFYTEYRYEIHFYVCVCAKIGLVSSRVFSSEGLSAVPTLADPIYEELNSPKFRMSFSARLRLARPYSPLIRRRIIRWNKKATFSLFIQVYFFLMCGIWPRDVAQQFVALSYIYENVTVRILHVSCLSQLRLCRFCFR